MFIDTSSAPEPAPISKKLATRLGKPSLDASDAAPKANVHRLPGIAIRPSRYTVRTSANIAGNAPAVSVNSGRPKFPVPSPLPSRSAGRLAAKVPQNAPAAQ